MLSWPYVAGFFDGEGSIRIRQMGCEASVSQSRLRGLRLLTEMRCFLALHGIASKVTPHTSDNPFQMYKLTISKRRNVIAFVRNMLPHLHIKKSECEDFVRYWKAFPPIGTAEFHAIRRHLSLRVRMNVRA